MPRQKGALVAPVSAEASTGVHRKQTITALPIGQRRLFMDITSLLPSSPAQPLLRI